VHEDEGAEEEQLAAEPRRRRLLDGRHAAVVCACGRRRGKSVEGEKRCWR
jgi:hypothetical protein